MAHQQTQPTSSQNQSSSGAQENSRGDDAQAARDASLGVPAKPDATSPYAGPGDAPKHGKASQHAADPSGPEQMKHPYYSEAQSTLGAFAPTERPGDHFAQPEDAMGALNGGPNEQHDSGNAVSSGARFATASGTVREGMAVVDSYGHMIGTVANIEGERLRLASSDPHDDDSAFLPVSLIAGVDGNRVLLAGRGDASFGMPTE